jgi:hypothetical protein
MWSRDSRELFYTATIDGSLKMIVVAVSPRSAGSSFQYGPPAVVLSLAGYFHDQATRTYDISPDGRRFLMVKAESTTAPPQTITVVSHWYEELRARMKAK